MRSSKAHFALATLLACVLLADAALAQNPAWTKSARTIVDPGTEEIFVSYRGRIYGCESCLLEHTSATSGPTSVLSRDGPVYGHFAKCATELARAMEVEIGGDPDRITFPTRTFVQRLQSKARAEPTRCGPPIPSTF